MEADHRLLKARVRHERRSPRRNAFGYDLFYLALPLSRLHDLPPVLKGSSALRFRRRDHGPRDGGELLPWARAVLAGQGLKEADGEIILVTMPRLFGYGFNPVSFWLCLDRAGTLRAVICEVNNTFGESHCYVCAHADQRPITAAQWLDADKVFHVSPFLPREGRYRFRFHLTEERFAVRIDYFAACGERILATSLSGRFEALRPESFGRVLRSNPLQSFKVTALIHWQALRLLVKGARFHRKPPQLPGSISGTRAGGRALQKVNDGESSLSPPRR